MDHMDGVVNIVDRRLDTAPSLGTESQRQRSMKLKPGSVESSHECFGDFCVNALSTPYHHALPANLGIGHLPLVDK